MSQGVLLDPEVVDLDSGQANDSGTRFRFEDGHWVFNLSNRALSTGTSILIPALPDGRRFQTGVVLR